MSDKLFTPPIIDARFICIADLNAVELSAVVSSYLSEEGMYSPFFAFPNLAVGFSEEFDFSDDNFISMMMGNEYSVLINNAIARLAGHNFILFIGLSDNQKSFLRHQFRYTKTPLIDIDSIDEVEPKLKELGINARDYLHCRKQELLLGLVKAKREGKVLLIEEESESIKDEDIPSQGIIIIEDNKELGAIVGINYAFSVSADVKIVETITDEERQGILRFIKKWYEGGQDNQLQKVIRKAESRIAGIDFTEYKYATFFTEGLPYSLYLDNCIPCSYVSLGLRPDLFVFNNIIFESIPRFHASVVFSPQFFKDEETKSLISLLEQKNLYVKTLVGRDATVGKFDFYTGHYPYDILHICSHGGEVDGYAVSKTFKDREGVSHTVEYDEVVGFSPVEGTDQVAVASMTIFRKFDGYIWRSTELENQKYPKYVYEDMRKALSLQNEKGVETKRDPKDRVPTSRAIKCSDSIHQGMFQLLASHSSPFIFNNTCWSWQEVATFFLAGGAKGYIGTLWAIGNTAAIRGANTFYDNAFTKPIILAFHDAIKAVENGSDRNIYVFWGLHFSTLEAGDVVANSKQRVYDELVRSFFAWGGKIETTRSAEVRKNSVRIINKIHQELKEDFGNENAERLAEKIRDAFENMESETREMAYKEEGHMLPESIEYPVEYIKNNN